MSHVSVRRGQGSDEQGVWGGGGGWVIRGGRGAEEGVRVIRRGWVGREGTGETGDG